MVLNKVKYCPKCQGMAPHKPFLMGSEVESLIWLAFMSLLVVFFSGFGLFSSIKIIAFCISPNTEILMIKSDILNCIFAVLADIVLICLYYVAFIKNLYCEICEMRTDKNLDNLL